MSWLKSAIKTVGNVIKDTSKISISPVTNLVSQVTDKKIDLGYQTGIGKEGGKITADISTLAHSPITNAISSVTGQANKNKYQTKVGGVVGKFHDTGNAGVNVLAKSFADAISGGKATDLKNWAGKGIAGDKYNKEKAFSYGEMGWADSNKTGIKAIDVAAKYVAPVSAVVGAAYGAKVGASAVGDLAGSVGTKTPDTSNIKTEDLQIGDNVLTNTPTDQGLINPNAPLSASFLDIDYKSPYFWVGIVVLLVLVVMVNKGNAKD